MQRTLLLLVLVLLSWCCAAPADAGAVTWLGGNDVAIGYGIGASTSLGTDFNGTWRWAVCSVDGTDCSAELSFPRTWNDRGTTLVIEREDFLSYGIDDEALVDIEAKISDWDTYYDRQGFRATGHPPIIGRAQYGNYRVRDFAIDRFEWTFNMNFASYTMQGQLFGSGIVVPEPSFVIILLPLMFLRRRVGDL